jgi:cell fate regulator YaaT (PSP1 superfamily)
MKRAAQQEARNSNLEMKVVECEYLFGGDRAIFYFTAEGRVDFRGLVKTLSHDLQTRIKMHQVGARDEARLLADFETCGQEVCCKKFLKSLKPVTMRMAKLQRATLDPTKVSGRCGRLKCCLRYEHEGYEELDAKLPRKGEKIKLVDGYGTVVDRQILTQLLRVARPEGGGVVAVVNEDVVERKLKEFPPEAERLAEMRVRAEQASKEAEAERQARRAERGAAEGKSRRGRKGDGSESGVVGDAEGIAQSGGESVDNTERRPGKRRSGTPNRRRGGRRRAGGQSGEQTGGQSGGQTGEKAGDRSRDQNSPPGVDRAGDAGETGRSGDSESPKGAGGAESEGRSGESKKGDRPKRRRRSRHRGRGGPNEGGLGGGGSGDSGSGGGGSGGGGGSSDPTC